MKKFFILMLVLLVVLPPLPGNFEPFAKEVSDLKLIVVAADFSDAQHKKEFSGICDELFSENGQSLNRFFKEASSGTIKVSQGPFLRGGWVRMPKPIIYYAQDNENSFDIRCHEMIDTLIREAVKNGLDFEEYAKSWSQPPCVCIVVSGGCEGYTNFPKDDGFWPHMSMSSVNIDGKTVEFLYVLVCEEQSVNSTASQVMAHEFGHIMGLADLYDYDCGGPFKEGDCGYPVTCFEIMAARHKGLGMSGFHRERMGFLRPVVVGQSGTYDIPPITSNANGSYLIVPIEGTKEYLALEYRKKEGIDAFWGGIPSEGLLVYKIDDSVAYRHRFNSGDENNHYAVEILNPGKTPWHENACYSIESGHTVASPKTDPSTLPFDKNYTKTVTLEVISGLGPALKVRITIIPKENIFFSMDRNWAVTGDLHKTCFKIRMFNKGSSPVVLDCDTQVFGEKTFDLGPDEGKGALLLLSYPKDKLKERVVEKIISVESENQSFTFKVLLRNVYFVMDYNSNGVIEEEDLLKIFSSLNNKEMKYDLDGDGVVGYGDLIVASRYVGIRYK
ncbi:MAG: M6 family metalloprotease domain-containing protein [Caldisericales bacterium]|nr:M6 family metalloprotease domain-containing protein [Caldisericales bacterium]